MKTDNIPSLLLNSFDYKDLDTKIENHIKLISKDWVKKGIEIYKMKPNEWTWMKPHQQLSNVASMNQDLSKWININQN